jgi:hypothetical protein
VSIGGAGKGEIGLIYPHDLLSDLPGAQRAGEIAFVGSPLCGTSGATSPSCNQFCL